MGNQPCGISRPPRGTCPRSRHPKAPCPAARRWVHLGDVKSHMLLEQVDAAAGSLDLAARRRRNRDPVSADLAEVLDQRRDRAVLCQQVFHHVVDRFEIVGLVGRPPRGKREHVVTRLRLGFGGDREQVLPPLRRDIVDLDLDLFLRRPFVAHLREHVICAGDPVVPEADFELAGGMRGADIRAADRGRSGGNRTGQESATIHVA